MSLLPDLDTWFQTAQPGDWAFTSFTNDPAGQMRIALRLTTAEDGVCILPIYQAGAPLPAGNGWLWDGNREAPTLTPSILHHSNPPWHGYLTAGKLVLA